jgi:hypothetical protein
MSSRHGTPLRGLMSAGRSTLFAGRFGRMFRSLQPAQFGQTEAANIASLTALGSAMSSTFDAPKDGPDDEESGIPALYTYFGQFIDHDITFDPASSLQKQNDPDALVDFRTPAFDLDNVYGRGPDDQPYLYDGANAFLLGSVIQGGNAGAHDLPRNQANPARALIGDPRNDENSIVSQLQGLFLRFHNRTLADNPSLPFAELQKRVRFHYQYVVLHDFLPRIVKAEVLSSLKVGDQYEKSKLKFFHWKDQPFMPVEFSAAAYRLGHSLVRPGYRLNDDVIKPIFPVKPDFPEGLTGFRAMNPAWGIDWARMIDIEQRAGGVALDDNGKTPSGGDPTAQQLADNRRRLQLAYRIDTSLVNPLANLPPEVASSPSSLAQRNLLRGWRLGLPSGQAIAKAMGVPPLSDEQIQIGKAVDNAGTLDSIASLPALAAFAGNCPVWAYILAEAMQSKVAMPIPVIGGGSVNTPQLGPVGGRIVAEVFLGLLFGDPSSLLSLDPCWHPSEGESYKLKDFVKYALGQ